MRRVEHVPRAFQAPVDVHASADGQVYMFKRKPHESADSSDDDDDELNVMEMRPRIYRDQEEAAASNVQLVEREVVDGDNLNKLALQYGCKVADIKRVNNLIQEQDLFALKSIKIPVQKHSFLTETYSDRSDLQEETHGPSGTAAKPRDRSGDHPDDVSEFLMEVDNDIERLIQTTDERNFLDLSERPRQFGFRGQRFTAHGADCGIQWWNAVIAMVLIGIALPLFYLIYFKTVSSGAASPADGAGASRAAASNSSGTDFGT